MRESVVRFENFNTEYTTPYQSKLSSENLFSNVQSLEALSKTCSYFDLMINGRYLTTVNLPLGRFIKDIKQSKILVKKPVLRLQCKTNLDMFVDTSFEAKKYVLETQFSLLDVSKVREVDLVPVNI